ncbi:MAG: DUF1232 domain-containing protein [Chloroflexota bacterium]
MSEDFSTKQNEPGFWRDLYQQARLIYALVRDPEVPIYLKFIPFFAVAYLLMPLDLIPDLAIGLGQLDDLTVILVMSRVFVEMVPDALVKKHRDNIRIIDGFEPEDDVTIIDQEVAEQNLVEKEPEA